MPLSVGYVLLNRYRVVKLIKQGGFGAVYRAWDLHLNVPCALKENQDINSADAQLLFSSEARMLANLTHINLPRVTNYFEVPGQGQYLVMDFVEGNDLEELLAAAGGALHETQVLPWAYQICDALITEIGPKGGRP